jgi:hypothetical protein
MFGDEPIFTGSMSLQRSGQHERSGEHLTPRASLVKGVINWDLGIAVSALLELKLPIPGLRRESPWSDGIKDR